VGFLSGQWLVDSGQKDAGKMNNKSLAAARLLLFQTDGGDAVSLKRSMQGVAPHPTRKTF